MDEMILQGMDVLFVGDLVKGNVDGTLAIRLEQFSRVVQLERKTAAVVRASLGRLNFSPRMALLLGLTAPSRHADYGESG